MPLRGTTPDETPTGVDHKGRRYNGLRIYQWDGTIFFKRAR
jgi:hypothetical protein